ncbi:hypothetical protein QE152_g41057 [Popillia japonica]|uniref:Uncharacterized protein n=1 Tax=Popillia japonica TaxID=7064 RepID=A0AAW1H6Y6_POPJA
MNSKLLSNAGIENEQNSIAMELDDNINNDVELDPELPDNLTNNKKTVSQKGVCIVCKESGSNMSMAQNVNERLIITAVVVETDLIYYALCAFKKKESSKKENQVM